MGNIAPSVVKMNKVLMMQLKMFIDWLLSANYSKLNYSNESLIDGYAATFINSRYDSQENYAPEVKFNFLIKTMELN